ncbi:MAG: hypothetical protein QOF78_4098 [Phycisphaerales bacterium]|jgi:hypothetical protein|nr:hypothetical protein [Phycisphaerales bacterium]
MVALRHLVVVVVIAGFVLAGVSNAAVLQLSGPGAFITPNSAANYDAWPELTVANNLYSAQGLTLSLPAGGNVPVYDWAGLGRATSSAPNVVAAVGMPGFNYSSAIDANFAAPITEVGAYMGNDQGVYDGSFRDFTLSVFDASNTLLGSVTVVANQNTSVDQFVGLRSSVPFVRARFENTDWVTANQGLSATFDDLTFSNVPEPTGLAAALLAATAILRRRRRAGQGC